MSVTLISPRKFKLLLIILSLAILACNKDETQSALDDDNGETEVNVERAEAMALYNDYYIASEVLDTETDWKNGDALNCESGDVPATILNKVLRRILYFRKAVGLNNTITVNTEKSAKAQEAALIMKVNGELSHNITSSWGCYSEAGAEGAKNSNLAIYGPSIRTNVVNAVDIYIDDFGASNFGVGHRRWLLWPKLYEIGIGGTDVTNAIWVVGNAGPRVTDALQFIAWPPAGYVPSELVYDRWSFSLNGADFSETSLTMTTKQGEVIALTVEELSGMFTDSTIVWVPENINTSSGEDIEYTVTLKNVSVDNEMQDFEYTVILFDKGF